jgi:hypothetical protein
MPGHILADIQPLSDGKLRREVQSERGMIEGVPLRPRQSSLKAIVARIGREIDAALRSMVLQRE